MFDIDNNWNIVDENKEVHSIDISSEENYENDDNYNEITMPFQEFVNDIYTFLCDTTKNCLRFFL